MTRGTGKDFMEEVGQGHLRKKEDGIGEQHEQRTTQSAGWEAQAMGEVDMEDSSKRSQWRDMRWGVDTGP